jgi:general secretion pathway protein H
MRTFTTDLAALGALGIARAPTEVDPPMHFRKPHNSPHRPGGFTLLELLVVLIIVGVVLGLVGANLGPDVRQTVRDEASRLAALLAHARDEAITTGVAVGWQSTDDGYRFLRRGADRTWRPVGRDDALHSRSLPLGVSLSVIEGAMQTSAAPPVIVLLPTGAVEPFRVTLSHGEHRLRVSFDGANAPVVEDARR